MEVDMRSSDPAALKTLDNRFHAALKAAVEEENQRWNNRGAVSVSAELVGVRPAGETKRDSAIVQSALAVSRALGAQEALREGSTDANVPMNLGIPAITIGGGGVGTGAHSLNESFDSRDSWKGTQRALLLALSLAR
jgi:acetylornithine deacetylase/succinyl-diaminopimelate desuccinylase-like protein